MQIKSHTKAKSPAWAGDWGLDIKGVKSSYGT
jgi:hypothetical protein